MSNWERLDIFVLQESVEPVTKGQKFPQEELDFILSTASMTNVLGRKISDIAVMAEREDFQKYLEAKYPGLDDEIRYRRMRDVLRKVHK